MRLRPELDEDRARVEALVADAFSHGGDRAHGLAVARLLAELRGLLDVGVGTSIVAELDGEPVGHVLCTRSWLDAPDRLVEVPVLSPLAVAPAHQGRGIGTALVAAAVTAMDEAGAPALFLEGSPDYYGRLGFVAGASLGLRKPSLRIPDPAFQVHPLSAHEPWMTGTLVYAEAFWRHDAVGLRGARLEALGGAGEASRA